MGFADNGTKVVAAIAVCAILILSILVPFVSNAGTVEKRFDVANEGTPLIQGDVSQDYNIQWDSALPGMVKINPKQLTVTFSPGQDATVSPASKTVVAGLTYGELPVPVRAGYTFGGWFTSTSYTTEVTEETIVGNTNVILYAKWTANTYTVTFDADGGTVSPATKTVTFGSAYGELPVPEYTGYNFGGWFDEDDNPITAATIVSIADDHTLTARWTAEQYLISFTTDGKGTVDVASMTADYDTPYTISGNTVTIGSTVVTATPDGFYVFDHWTPSTSGTISGATTFIANFNLPPVTLSFAAQSPGSVDTQTVADIPRGTQYTVLDNTVVLSTDPAVTVTASLPNGYYMIGWNIGQGTGTVTDAMTFTASYEEIKIEKVVCSTDTTWAITTDGKLFGCGHNDRGQQGDGTTTDVTTFTQRLTDETIESVSASTVSTWALTTDGKLFGCGISQNGQQSSGTTTNVTTFTQRLTDETIESVSASYLSTWALTTDSKLFGCGSNGSGQQGNNSSSSVTTFTQRLTDETIESVSISDNTTWALTTDGKLFGCGSNNYGQQGSGDTTNVRIFTERSVEGSVYIKVAATFSAQSPGSVDTAQINVPVGTQYTVLDNTITFEGVGTVTASLPNGYYMTGWNVAQGTGTMTEAMTFTAEYELIEIEKVVATTDTTWILTTNGELFGCGRNNSGQQGNGNTNSVLTFTQRLNNETIADVVCSAETTWAITTDGKLFGCGNGDYGQQGGNFGSPTLTFTQRLSNETIAKVSCSQYTIWVVTTDGKLFGCGANNNGQQGNGNTNSVLTFTQRLNNETIADVVCSAETTWAITTDGKLFGCGRNVEGQQGDDTSGTSVTTFTQRLNTETIAKVYCQNFLTWAVTTDGKLFGCGYNDKGQQGDGTSGTGTKVTTFTQRLTDETIASVSCTDQTTWAVTTDSKLFGCGYNNQGQQGDGTTTNVTTFTQRLNGETIADVSCSSNTTWAVTTDGKLFGCGSSSAGQQGSGSTTAVNTFTQRLNNENIKQHSTANGLTWAVTTDGKLFGCGSNSYGQQGSGNTVNAFTFTQRYAAGTVNIPAQINPQIQPLNVPRFSPAPMLLNSVSPASIVGTDYTFHAGGTGWLLCTVSVGQDQYALALFSSSLQSPLLWDEDAALMFSNGTMTCENDGVTYTMTYTDIYFEGNGGYVLTTGTANVKDDTNIIAFSVPSPGDAVQVTGTLDDLTAAVLSGSSSAGAVTATSEDTEYEEIKNVTEISAEYGSDTAVCSSIIVPNKVSVVREVNDEVMGTLLSIVPMVTIVGLILAVLGTFMFKRQ